MGSLAEGKGQKNGGDQNRQIVENEDEIFSKRSRNSKSAMTYNSDLVSHLMSKKMNEHSLKTKSKQTKSFRPSSVIETLDTQATTGLETQSKKQDQNKIAAVKSVRDVV